MEAITSMGEGNREITVFMMAHGNALPDATRDQVIQAQAQPQVAMLVDVMEALYACPEKTPETSTMVARLADYLMTTGSVGFHGVNVDNRASRISQAMQRDLGNTAPPGAPWPDPETDPTPEQRFTGYTPPSDPPPVPLPVPPAE